MTGLRGKFIVFDGTEGCGKSTQAKLLRQRVMDDPAAGLSADDVLLVRDPGTTAIGEKVRAILLDPANAEMAMRCEMLLYMASRAQMMHETILPALAAGKCVICDRFVSSTLAYQLGGDGLTAQDIRTVANVAISNRWPDITIIFDMPVHLSSARLDRPLDRIEQRPISYHEQVRKNYLLQAKDSPSVHILEADRDPKLIHADVMKLLDALK